MGADPIVYCLQQVTDYDQFERFCNDLMVAEGYENLEPLGGSGDKGRDAIRISRSNPDDITVFAYSVREDWFKKLTQDSKRINEVGHKLNNLVFCCTSNHSASDRDKAIEFILQNYGWRLEIYGLERIRNLLATVHERIITKHRQIFTPPFFPRAGGQSLVYSPDLTIIDFANSDEALASWLAQKLKLHGYLVWCRSIDPVAGESINDTTDALLEQRAACCVTILSQPAFEDNDFTYRRSSAVRIAKKQNSSFLIPIVAQPIYNEALDSYFQSLEQIDFSDSWFSGLNKLIEALEAKNCLVAQGGEQLILNSYFHNDVVFDQEESLFSNVYEVLNVPKVIQRYQFSRSMSPSERADISSRWAFRKVNDSTVLSFHQPPQRDISKFEIFKNGGSIWSHSNAVDGIPVKNLVLELLKKSLVVACQKKGLHFCFNTFLPYFPQEMLKSDRFYFDFLDGSKSHIKVCGQRKYFRPKASEYYRYHLAPKFYISERSAETYAIILHVYIRLTDLNGRCLEGKKIASRRKHLCKNWYNEEWSKRVFAIMQFLGNGENITIGENENEKILINAHPFKWTVPVSIDEQKLSSQPLASTLEEEQPGSYEFQGEDDGS